MNNNKKVGIVVVTYNRIALLKELIKSLRIQTYTDFQIVVVDNGSTDETSDWLLRQGDVHTITQANLGGAGGFYAGMKYVAEQGMGYCWLMDDDVECYPTALAELIVSYEAKSNIGFLCSKVVGINGDSMNTPEIDDRPFANGYACYDDLISYQMIKVKSATFVSVFLSTAIIYEMGLPYKEYFIWGDDTEYTLRISRKYDCYLVCKSKVIHKRAIQSGLSFFTESNPQRLQFYYYMFRNEGHLFLKDAKAYEKFRWWASRIILLLMLFLRFDLNRFKIVLKASIAVANFYPTVKFPHK